MEDEPKLANLLRKGLTAQGLAADVASHGDEAMYMATATAYDAITLDVMLLSAIGHGHAARTTLLLRCVGDRRRIRAADRE